MSCDCYTVLSWAWQSEGRAQIQTWTRNGEYTVCSQCVCVCNHRSLVCVCVCRRSCPASMRGSWHRPRRNGLKRYTTCYNVITVTHVQLGRITEQPYADSWSPLPPTLPPHSTPHTFYMYLPPADIVRETEAKCRVWDSQDISTSGTIHLTNCANVHFPIGTWGDCTLSWEQTTSCTSWPRGTSSAPGVLSRE